MAVYVPIIDRIPNQIVECACGCGRTRPALTPGGHFRCSYISGHGYRGRGRPFVERFWEKVNKDGPVHHVLGTPCWPYGACRGYGAIEIDGRRQLAHRVSWQLANGPIPDGLWVLHHCDNKPCVRPDHLFLGTDSDNLRDCYQKGRRKGFFPGIPGENCLAAKLSDAEVKRIRELRASGLSRDKVAAMFGISPGHVWRIVNRRRRANI